MESLWSIQAIIQKFPYLWIASTTTLHSTSVKHFRSKNVMNLIFQNIFLVSKSSDVSLSVLCTLIYKWMTFNEFSVKGKVVSTTSWQKHLFSLLFRWIKEKYWSAINCDSAVDLVWPKCDRNALTRQPGPMLI